MNNKIKILMLCLLSGSSLFASQVKQGFSASIFWQVPIASSNAQFMFSDQNPVDLVDVYHSTSMSSGTCTIAEVLSAITKKAFGQYVVGSYFASGSNASGLYIIGPTKQPPLVIKPVKKPAITINISETRLAALGIRDYMVPAIGIGIKNSAKGLIKLGYFLSLVPDAILYNLNQNPKEWSSGLVAVCFEGGAVDNFATLDSQYVCNNLSMQYPNAFNLNVEYNPDNIIPLYILRDLGYILSHVFQSSLITQKTNFTAQSFGPVSGVKMQGSTYFEQDNVLFALHLTTPGRTTAITKDTSLVDVMSQQNTYPDMYPLEGVTTCGDNFGF